MPHDVFISYSSKDKTTADAVCAKLEEQKIRCWFAPRDIAPGQNFARSIIDAINASKVFVLIWSIDTNVSEHVMNEINQAFDRGVTIVPFRIENVQPTSEMRYYFGRTHWLDAIDPPLEKHIGTLAEIIHAILGVGRENPPQPEEKEIGTPLERAKELSVPVAKTREIPLKEEASPANQPGLTAERNRRIGKKGVLSENKLPHAPLANKKGIIPISAGILLVAATAILYFLGVFNGFSLDKIKFAGIASITPNRGVASLPSPMKDSPTAQPTAAAETADPAVLPTLASLPNWVGEFSAPVLEAIKNRPPDFQDDFSTTKPDWSYSLGPCPNTSVKIVAGKLRLQKDPGNDCFASASLEKLFYKNVVAQVDVDLNQLEHGQGYFNGAQMWTWDKSNGEVGQSFSIGSDGRWRWGHCDLAGCAFDYENSIALGDDLVVKVTLISLGTRTALYLDEVPIYYVEDVQRSQNIILLSLNSESGTSKIYTVRFDNFKMWDLDKIESLSSLINP